MVEERVRDEALMVRHRAAMRMLADGSVRGPEALVFVVCPSPEALAASVVKAEQNVAAGRSVVDREFETPTRMARELTLREFLDAARR